MEELEEAYEKDLHFKVVNVISTETHAKRKQFLIGKVVGEANILGKRRIPIIGLKA